MAIDKDPEELPAEFSRARSRLMYIEDKSGGLEGDARIGRVYFSKSGKTLYYRGKKFRSLKGSGFKANFFVVGTGDEYWISGPRRDRDDRLYGGSRGVEVDEDVAAEYRAYLRGEDRVQQSK
jgi:hypothetical protein